MRHPLLLGLDNPHSDNPRAALLPRPAGSAGHRLFLMSGLSWREYRRSFERANACDIKSLRILEDRYVVVLGRDAWRVIIAGAGVFFEERLFPELRSVIILVPHPSGRNRFYNEPANQDRLTALLGKVRQDYINKEKKP